MVIAIIAILAAILFPVFAKAREKARQSSCASNLKQMAIAMASYAQDYDETLHPHRDLVSSTYGWTDIIAPYVKNQQIFRCPSNSNTPTVVGAATNIGTHYGWSWNELNLKSLAQITKPAETIAYADSISYVISYYQMIYRPLALITKARTWPGSTVTRSG